MEKKKKCSMPSDNMRGAAKRKYTKSSECVSTNTSAPVSLDQFEKEDRYVQTARVRAYGKNYGWTVAVVAEKLGTTEENAEKILRRLNLSELFSKSPTPLAAAPLETKDREEHQMRTFTQTSQPVTEGKASEKVAEQYTVPQDANKHPMLLSQFMKLPPYKQVALCHYYGKRYGWCAEAVACALDTTEAVAKDILKRYALEAFFKESNGKLDSDARATQLTMRGADTGRKRAKRSENEATPGIFKQYEESPVDMSAPVTRPTAAKPAATKPVIKEPAPNAPVVVAPPAVAKPVVEPHIATPKTVPATAERKLPLVHEPISKETHDLLGNEEPLPELLYLSEFMRLAKALRRRLLLDWGEAYGWNARTLSMILGTSSQNAESILAEHRCLSAYKEKKTGNKKDVLAQRRRRRDAALAAREEKTTPVPTQGAEEANVTSAADNSASSFAKIRIEGLGFSVATLNALRRGGCNTAQDLIEMDRQTIDGLRNVGNRSIFEVAEHLSRMGAPMNAWEELRQERAPTTEPKVSVPNTEPDTLEHTETITIEAKEPKPLAEQAEELEAALPRELLSLLVNRYEAAAAKDATLVGNFTKFSAQGDGKTMAARLHAFADTLSPDTEYSIKLTISGT